MAPKRKVPTWRLRVGVRMVPEGWGAERAQAPSAPYPEVWGADKVPRVGVPMVPEG